jgi:hypothetical protein
MGETFGAISVSVRFLDENPIGVESPRSQQLNAFRRHFYYKFIRELARGDEWVVAYSKDVHGSLEQVK